MTTTTRTNIGKIQFSENSLIMEEHRYFVCLIPIQKDPTGCVCVLNPSLWGYLSLFSCQWKTNEELTYYLKNSPFLRCLAFFSRNLKSLLPLPGGVFLAWFFSKSCPDCFYGRILTSYQSYYLLKVVFLWANTSYQSYCLLKLKCILQPVQESKPA